VTSLRRPGRQKTPPSSYLDATCRIAGAVHQSTASPRRKMDHQAIKHDAMRGGPGRDLVPCTPTSWSRGALQPINHPRSVFPRSSSSSPDRVTAGGHDCNACLFCACQRVVYGPAASSNNGHASPVSTTPLRSSLPTVYHCRRPFPSRPAPPTHHLVASLITLQQQLDSVARKATTNQPATYLTYSNGCLNKQRQS